jgi:hypothetical protein
MRLVGEIAHPDCKITIYAWNNKYLIKFEQDYLEQTFKINEYDVMGDDHLRKILDPEFIKTTLDRFENMGQSWSAAIDRS